MTLLFWLKEKGHYTGSQRGKQLSPDKVMTGFLQERQRAKQAGKAQTVSGHRFQLNYLRIHAFDIFHNKAKNIYLCLTSASHDLLNVQEKNTHSSVWALCDP